MEGPASLSIVVSEGAEPFFNFDLDSKYLLLAEAFVTFSFSSLEPAGLPLPLRFCDILDMLKKKGLNVENN